jgi:c-di-GMP-binding flagellar brake protein YcgR
MEKSTSKSVWARGRSQDRRVYPRVSVAFPLELRFEDETLHGVTLDLGLGGMRATVDHAVTKGIRVRIRMELPITDRAGLVRTETLVTAARVVRAIPFGLEDTQAPWDLGLAFEGGNVDRDRVLGTFLLQTLLFDPGAELV